MPSVLPQRIIPEVPAVLSLISLPEERPMLPDYIEMAEVSTVLPEASKSEGPSGVPDPPSFKVSEMLLESSEANTLAMAPSMLPGVSTSPETPAVLPEAAPAAPSVAPEASAESPTELPESTAPEVPEPSALRIPMELTDTPPLAKPAVLPDITEVLPEPTPDLPAVLAEQVSEVPAVLPEPVSEIQAVLPNETSGVPTLLPEPSSKVPVVLPEPTSAIPAVLPEPASEVSVVLPDSTSEDSAVLPEASSESTTSDVPTLLPKPSTLQVSPQLPDTPPPRKPAILPESTTEVPEVFSKPTLEIPALSPDPTSEVPAVLPESTTSDVPKVLPESSSSDALEVLPEPSALKVSTEFPYTPPPGKPAVLPEPTGEVPLMVSDTASEVDVAVIPEPASKVPGPTTSEVPTVLPEPSPQEVPTAVQNTSPGGKPAMLPEPTVEEPALFPDDTSLDLSSLFFEEIDIAETLPETHAQEKKSEITETPENQEKVDLKNTAPPSPKSASPFALEKGEMENLETTPKHRFNVMSVKDNSEKEFKIPDNLLLVNFDATSENESPHTYSKIMERAKPLKPLLQRQRLLHAMLNIKSDPYDFSNCLEITSLDFGGKGDTDENGVFWFGRNGDTDLKSEISNGKLQRQTISSARAYLRRSNRRDKSEPRLQNQRSDGNAESNVSSSEFVIGLHCNMSHFSNA